MEALDAYITLRGGRNKQLSLAGLPPPTLCTIVFMSSPILAPLAVTTTAVVLAPASLSTLKTPVSVLKRSPLPDTPVVFMVTGHSTIEPVQTPKASATLLLESLAVPGPEGVSEGVGEWGDSPAPPLDVPVSQIEVLSTPSEKPAKEKPIPKRRGPAFQTPDVEGPVAPSVQKGKKKEHGVVVVPMVVPVVVSSVPASVVAPVVVSVVPVDYEVTAEPKTPPTAVRQGPYYPSYQVHERVKALLRMEIRQANLREQAKMAQVDIDVQALHAYNLAHTRVQLGNMELHAVMDGVGGTTWNEYIIHQRKKETDQLVSPLLIAPLHKLESIPSSRKITRQLVIPRGLTRGAILVVSTRKGKGGGSPGPAPSEMPDTHGSESQNDSDSDNDFTRNQTTTDGDSNSDSEGQDQSPSEEEKEETELDRVKVRHALALEEIDNLRAQIELTKSKKRTDREKDTDISLPTKKTKKNGKNMHKEVIVPVSESMLWKYFPKQTQRVWQHPLKVSKASVYGPLVGEVSLPKYAGDYEDEGTVIEWAKRLSNLFFRVAGVPKEEAVSIMSQCFADQSPAYVLFQRLLEENPDITYQEVLVQFCDEFMGSHTREVHGVALNELRQEGLSVAQLMQTHAKLWARVYPDLSPSHQLRDLPHRLTEKMREEFFKWEARMYRQNKTLSMTSLLSHLMQKERDFKKKEDSFHVLFTDRWGQEKSETAPAPTISPQLKRGDRQDRGAPANKKPALERKPRVKDFTPPNCKRCGSKPHPEGVVCWAIGQNCNTCNDKGHLKGSPMCFKS
jgi:hypothetical protein